MQIRVNFGGLLQITFIILKLCNVINWSWGAVLIPLWISIFLWFLLILLEIYSQSRK